MTDVGFAMICNAFVYVPCMLKGYMVSLEFFVGIDYTGKAGFFLLRYLQWVQCYDPALLIETERFPNRLTASVDLLEFENSLNVRKTVE